MTPPRSAGPRRGKLYMLETILWQINGPKILVSPKKITPSPPPKILHKTLSIASPLSQVQQSFNCINLPPPSHNPSPVSRVLDENFRPFKPVNEYSEEHLRALAKVYDHQKRQ